MLGEMPIRDAMARFDIPDTAISAMRRAVAEIWGDEPTDEMAATGSPSRRSSPLARADQCPAPSTVKVESAWWSCSLAARTSPLMRNR